MFPTFPSLIYEFGIIVFLITQMTFLVFHSFIKVAQNSVFKKENNETEFRSTMWCETLFRKKEKKNDFFGVSFIKVAQNSVFKKENNETEFRTTLVLLDLKSYFREKLKSPIFSINPQKIV